MKKFKIIIGITLGISIFFAFGKVCYWGLLFLPLILTTLSIPQKLLFFLSFVSGFLMSFWIVPTGAMLFLVSIVVIVLLVVYLLLRTPSVSQALRVDVGDSV